MTDLQHGRDDGVLFIKARHMQAAQAKWDRLTAGDLSQIRDQDQLIDRVWIVTVYPGRKLRRMW